MVIVMMMKMVTPESIIFIKLRVTRDGVCISRVQRSIKSDKHLNHDVITLLIEPFSCDTGYSDDAKDNEDEFISQII